MRRRNKTKKVEEVQIENNIKSNRELTPTQKDDLNNLLNRIDKEVDETTHVINKIKSLKNFKIRGFANEHYIKRIIQASVVLIFLFAMLFYCGYYMEISNFNKEYQESVCETTQTKINISMNTESKLLEYEVVSASILGENNIYTEINNFDWVKSDIDTNYDKYNIEDKEYILEKNIDLSSLIINDSYMYIEYANEDKNANKEIILCSAKPLDIDTSDIQKQTLRFFEKSNPIMIKSYVNSFNNSFLMVNEAIGGGELNIDTLEKEINNIESEMTTSEKCDGFILELCELGSLNIKQLNEFKDSPQVMYNSSDGILRIGNKNMNENSLYIFSIYNEKLGIKPEDLLETNIDKVFIHKQFDDENSTGYNTFVVLTENNLYCFKATNRDLVLEVLDNLGFDSSLLTIDKIQSVIRKQD